MWSALPDAHVRLALAPDVRLVRASDCASGWRGLSDARVCTSETDHSERVWRAIPNLVVLILKYGDRLSYVSMVASFASFGTLETNRNVPEVPIWLPRSAGEPAVPQPPNALRSCLLASRTHSLVRLPICPSEQLHDSAIASAGWSHDRLVNPPFRNLPMHCVAAFLLAVRTH